MNPRWSHRPTETLFGADATDHNANVGVVANGDRLVALFVNDGTATVTTPNGWNLLNSEIHTTLVRASWYYRDTDGSDSGGTVNFITSAAEQATCQIWRYLAGTFDAATAPQIATPVVAGPATTRNPPSLSPSWGAGIDTAYLFGWGMDNDDATPSVEKWPVNGIEGSYIESAAGSNNTAQATATALNDSGSFDPAPWTGMASANSISNTVAIKGAAPHGEPYPTNLITGFSVADATSYASASITPPASRPVLAAVWSHVSAGNPNQPTASGNGITWTAVASVLFDTDRLTLFLGFNAAPSAGVLTFDFGGQTQIDAFWNVCYWEHLEDSPVVQFKTATGTNTAPGSPTADFDNAFADPDNVTLSVLGRVGVASPSVTPDTGFLMTSHPRSSNNGGLESEFKVGEEQTPAPVISHIQDWEQIIVELAREIFPPDAPVLTVGSVTVDSIDLSWTDPGGETGFRIERSADGLGGWVDLGDNAAGDTTFTDTGRDCETEYFYRIFAFNSAGDSPASNVDSGTTDTCPPPVDPSNLVATATGPTEISLVWDDNSNDENGFRVERSPDGLGSWVNVSGSLAIGTEAYLDSGLTCETEYFYRVIAFSGEGDSGPSNTDSATTLTCPPPSAEGNRMGGTGAVRKPPRPSR